MARRLSLDLVRGDGAAAGVVGLAAIAALALAQSPWRDATAAWLAQEVPVRVGGWSETLPMRLWPRDGLMTLFFFGLGLELKCELSRGELSTPRRLALPLLAAFAGLAAATAVYAGSGALSGAANWSGWPAALGADTTLVLALVGLGARPSPAPLRAFALSVALIDNVVLVVVLAMRHSGGVDAEALAAAAAALCFLALLSRWRGAPLTLFAAGFATLWATTLRAGVDPAAAGLAAALMLPMRPRRTGERGLVDRARHALRPLLAYAVAPAFVFCAVAPHIQTALGSRTADPHPGAILAVALAAKGVGAIAACALAARLGWVRRPSGFSWRDLGVAALASAVSLTCGLYASSASGAPEAMAAILATSLGLFVAAAWVLLQRGSRVAPTR